MRTAFGTGAPDHRLLELLLLLLDAERALTRAEIFEAIPAYRTAKPAAGERKFERDKKDLRDLGVPLEEGGDDTNAYSIDRELYELPSVDLDDEERAALVIAAEAVRSTSGLAYRDLVEEALHKLTFERGAGAGNEMPALMAVSLSARDPRRALAKVVTRLTSAAEGRKRIRITYGAKHGPGTEREVDPHVIIYRSGTWLLVGHCHLRKDTRTFRVDRISQLRVAPKPGTPDFDRPDPTTLGRSLLRSPWVFEAGGQTVDVILDVGPERTWIADEDFGAEARREPLKGGWTRLYFRSGNTDYIVTRVLDGAGQLRVTAPESLRAQVARTAAAVVGLYADEISR